MSISLFDFTIGGESSRKRKLESKEDAERRKQRKPDPIRQLLVRGHSLLTLLDHGIELCRGAQCQQNGDQAMIVDRTNRCLMLSGFPPSVDGMLILLPPALNGGKHEEAEDKKSQTDIGAFLSMISNPGASQRVNQIYSETTLFFSEVTHNPTNWEGTWLGPYAEKRGYRQAFKDVELRLHARTVFHRELSILQWRDGSGDLKQFSSSLVTLIASFLPRVEESWLGRTVVRRIAEVDHQRAVAKPQFREIRTVGRAQVDFETGDVYMFHPDGLLVTVCDGSIVRFLGGTFAMPVTIRASCRAQVFLSGSSFTNLVVELTHASILHARRADGAKLVVRATHDARVLTDDVNVTSRFIAAQYDIRKLAQLERQ